ncbi:hypothetical protein PC118_g653 [Phytophthora cactorum]|uniref:Uncharacterized protein n=1 Tax=Phytophthora cactorum TaxID=29920 RepID=A0A8T1GM27_9STRA|nr:hypothetical protein PC111_g5940 [Phytophthora cactorum]KAG2848210.1 hypothetical protein PC112_g825 [Phytophthora cactorum]KAG2868539.1 hypothetical protein PC113_g1012 [Phytophthora cactorum]KAG2935262.1 hypothetical protein PC114_g642 [Phytophthora cactorum]KAG2942939.1 hypothetical protein PC115_g1173 [Phytophthora cactorum]
MTAEQENGDDRPKRTWNSSTKLTQPRRTAASTVRIRERQAQQVQSGAGRAEWRPRLSRQARNNLHRVEESATEAENDQQTLTRELLERAVSTAFGGLLQDSTLDAAAFPDDRESQSSELSSVREKENTPPISSPATKIEAKLRTTLEKSTSLSANHRQRRREHTEALQQATNDTKAAREFQRRMKHASFEHRERKLAVQALQARIQREIEFLTATAVDLEKREFLLDDAFESYERALRLELGLVDNVSNQQVEASPWRSY